MQVFVCYFEKLSILLPVCSFKTFTLVTQICVKYFILFCRYALLLRPRDVGHVIYPVSIHLSVHTYICARFSVTLTMTITRASHVLWTYFLFMKNQIFNSRHQGLVFFLQPHLCHFMQIQVPVHWWLIVHIIQL